jgi:peptidoglycan/LPS O-acetylase OafA/YrhL
MCMCPPVSAAVPPPQDLPVLGVQRAGAPHVPLLDGVRGVAILLVLAHHLTVLDGAAAGFDGWFARTLGLGWCGVDLFFVLSGYLITGILFDSRAGRHYFRSFYARRILRIFPLYYAVTFAFLVALPVLAEHVPRLARSLPPAFGQSRGQGVWFWTYLCNYAMAFGVAFPPALGACWSLAVEEQFYLLWPFVIRFLSAPMLRRICAGLLVASFTLRIVLVGAGAPFLAVYVLTPTRMDCLAVGAMIALAFRMPRPSVAATRLAPRILALSLITLLTVAALQGSLDREGPIMLTAGFSAVPLLFGSLLVIALEGGPGSLLSRALTTSFLRFFGKYSYALYLFHIPFRSLIRGLLYGPLGGDGHPRFHFLSIAGSQVPGQLLFYLVAGIPCVGAALLSWYCFERPFLSLKRFFPVSR